MSYKRKVSRPPRTVEQTEAMRERDELRQHIDRLASRNHELLLQVRERDQKLLLNDYEVERLLHDKVELAIELREARTVIDFLKGKYRRWPHA
jgi:hypothetical protein